MTEWYFQIASVIEEAWAAEYIYIGIIIDTEAIRKLQVWIFGIINCGIWWSF